jgi:hypothetical protein
MERKSKMTLSQKRRRRVELLIDQRLVGFLKPRMSISSGPVRPQPEIARYDSRRVSTIEPTTEERAS